MSAEQRQVIVELYYHHRSVAETAGALGIRPSGVLSLAYSAVRQLPVALAIVTSCTPPAPQPAADLLTSASLGDLSARCAAMK